MNKIELLAPAGTYSCVLAAVNSGADAVYFAGQSFGARSFAGNLTDEEIYKATDFCHLRGTKSYLTVNTLIFDREFKEVDKLIKTATKAGIDGIIVQDMGVLKRVKEISPDVEVHASTQMTVHSIDGANELYKMGVKRVVLSRELSGREIKEITENTSVETEVFVHGAMCMSYSGQCLMSSVIGSRSGNRGKCAQPCRLPYSKDEKCYLSLKDMSYMTHIKELFNYGVASLKIEGRMKGESYVSTVVSQYRTLIDQMREPTKEEIDAVNRVFFRGGLTDGYFADKKGKQMFAFVKPDNPYLKNDNNTKIFDEKKTAINIFASFEEEKEPCVIFTCQEKSIEVKDDKKIERANNRPTQKEDIKKQLLKLGDTPFVAENVEIKISENAFVPLSLINDLRRNAASCLCEKILDKYKNKRINVVDTIEKKPRDKDCLYTASVLSFNQYAAICDMPFERIYVPIHIIEENIEKIDCKKTVVCLPVILKSNERKAYRKRLEKLKEKGFSKVLVSTIDGFEIADGFEKYGSYRLNITNSIAFSEYEKKGLLSVCLSPELNLAQIRDIQKRNSEIIAYGRLPLMITENCILKNMDKCRCLGFGKIKDRTGREFVITKDGDICKSVVLNSVPLYMADKVEDLKNIGIRYLSLMFTDESQERCKEIADAYMNSKKLDDFEYTRLQFYKKTLE